MELGLQLVRNPPYSPDSAHLYHYLVPNIKKVAGKEILLQLQQTELHQFRCLHSLVI